MVNCLGRGVDEFVFGFEEGGEVYVGGVECAEGETC